MRFTSGPLGFLVALYLIVSGIPGFMGDIGYARSLMPAPLMVNLRQGGFTWQAKTNTVKRDIP